MLQQDQEGEQGQEDDQTHRQEEATGALSGWFWNASGLYIEVPEKVHTHWNTLFYGTFKITTTYYLLPTTYYLLPTMLQQDQEGEQGQEDDQTHRQEEATGALSGWFWNGSGLYIEVPEKVQHIGRPSKMGPSKSLLLTTYYLLHTTCYLLATTTYYASARSRR